MPGRSDQRISVRSAIPGRVRWEASALLRDFELAEEIRRTLSADLRIVTVDASPITGTVLVMYRYSGDPEVIGAEIGRSLANILDRWPGEALPAGPEPLSDFATTAVLVSVPLTIFAVTSATPILAVSSLAALAVSLVHFATTVEESGQAAAEERTLVARLVAEIKPYRRQLSIAAICGFLTVGLGLLRFVLIGLAIEMVIPAGAMTVPIAGARTQIIGLGVITIAVSGFLGLSEYAGQRYWRGVAAQVQQRLRLLAYQTLQRAEMAFIGNTPSSELQTMVLDDVQQFERFISVAWEVYEQALNVIIVMAIYFYISPNVAWLALFGVSATIYSTSALQRRVIPQTRLLRDAGRRLAASTTTSAEGLATIKGNAAESLRLSRMRELGEAQVRLEKDVNRVVAAYVPAIEMSVMGSLIATSVGGGLLSGSEISVAQYSTMIMLTRQLLLPMIQLGRTLETFQRSAVGLERLFRFLDTTPLEDGTGAPLPRAAIRGEVVYRDVSFDYPGGEPVIRHVSLEAASGETTAIVGPTGSGKSTLLRLLLRFHDHQRGELLLDGIPVDEVRLHDLRRSFGVVGQEVYLFPETLAENIALGRPGATLEEIRQAAALSGADEFIMRMPRGYDTLVGERGFRLSGGERQRVAIARALLTDAPVLIFDEATSHLDNESENELYGRLSTAMRNRTMVVVAHRLAAARRANRIYVLEEGRVRETGTHDELVARSGLYATLWRLQTNGG